MIISSGCLLISQTDICSLPPFWCNIFTITQTFTSGIVRVVFADDSHMMLYECGLISNDGSCAGGQASVEILNRVAEPLESGLQYQLTKRLSELCIDVSELEPVPHDGMTNMILAVYHKKPI